MSENVRVVIGQVLGAHGVKGEVKIRPLTDFPERFLDMKIISLYREGRPVGTYAVLQIRDVLARDCFLASLEGVENMDQAQALRGSTVEISPEERVPLEDGEFWISDLIGLDVFDEHNARLGTVKDIVDSGASQLLVITDSDGKDHLIPAVPEFLRDVSLESRRVELQLIEGLWEL